MGSRVGQSVTSLLLAVVVILTSSPRMACACGETSQVCEARTMAPAAPTCGSCEGPEACHRGAPRREQHNDGPKDADSAFPTGCHDAAHGCAALCCGSRVTSPPLTAPHGAAPTERVVGTFAAVEISCPASADDSALRRPPRR